MSSRSYSTSPAMKDRRITKLERKEKQRQAERKKKYIYDFEFENLIRANVQIFEATDGKD